VHNPHDNIALRTSGNAQGSYYILSLHSGKKVIRNRWTVLPMPVEVITTVQQLAATCKACSCQGNIWATR